MTKSSMLQLESQQVSDTKERKHREVSVIWQELQYMTNISAATTLVAGQ